MKLTQFVALCWICPIAVIGQISSEELISSSGDHFIGNNAQLSWSIGEMVVETSNSSQNQLTQGFHQSGISLISIDYQSFAENSKLSLYPNPTNSKVYFEFSNNIQVKSIEVFDLAGKLLEVYSIESNGLLPLELNLEEYENGIYFIRFQLSDGGVDKLFKVLKTNQV